MEIIVVIVVKGTRPGNSNSDNINTTRKTCTCRTKRSQVAIVHVSIDVNNCFILYSCDVCVSCFFLFSIVFFCVLCGYQHKKTSSLVGQICVQRPLYEK